jgi:hypothetical protein
MAESDGKLEAAVAAVTAPTEFKIELPTGEVFKGKSWEEVANAAAKAKLDTTTAYKTEKERREALEAQVAAAVTPAPQPANGNGFDAAKYWTMINEGKLLDAEKYKLGALFELEPEMVVSTFRETVRKTDEVYDTIEIEKFKSTHPDFPGGEEASAAVMGRVKEYGGTWDAKVLHRAYKDLVEEGRVKPLQLEDAAQQAFNAPPVLDGGSSGGQGDALLDQFQNLTTDQMEQVLRKAGKLR